MKTKLKIYVVQTDFGKYEVAPVTCKYSYGDRLAIELEEKSGEPFAVLTVNIDSMFELAEDEAFVDTNNCSWAEKFIKKHKLGKPTGNVGYSGFCVYPLYKFDLTKLNKVQE